jgi:hypothetical protein
MHDMIRMKISLCKIQFDLPLIFIKCRLSGFETYSIQSLTVAVKHNCGKSPKFQRLCCYLPATTLNVFGKTRKIRRLRRVNHVFESFSALCQNRAKTPLLAGFSALSLSFP